MKYPHLRISHALAALLVAATLVAAPSESDAGFTMSHRSPVGPMVGFAPNPAGGDPTSDAINRNVRAAIALIRGTGRTIQADALERKLTEGNICMEISRRNPPWRGVNQTGTCNINIRIDLVLNADNLEELAYVLLHEYTHSTAAFTQADLEHCYAYWQQFLYQRERLAQIGTPTTQKGKAAKLFMQVDLLAVLKWYPEFGPFTDPETEAPLTPPGNFSDPTAPDRTLSACSLARVSAHAEGTTPKNAHYVTDGTGDIFGSLVDFSTGLGNDVTISTGLVEVRALETIVLSSAGEHAVLFSGLDPMSGEHRVGVATDSNADLLVDSATVLPTVGAPLQSAIALLSAPQPSAENRFFVLDNLSGEVRHIDDLNADGLPDVVGATYAPLSLTPNLQLVNGLQFLGDFDNAANPLIPTTPTITSFHDSDDRIAATDFTMGLPDANGDGVADEAVGPAVVGPKKISAPAFVLQPMHRDESLTLLGTFTHSIEVQAIRGTTVEVLAVFSPTVGGLTIPGLENLSGAQVALSRRITPADTIRLVDLNLVGSVAPVERAVSSRVPEIRSIAPSVVTPIPGGTIVITGRNFKTSSRVMFDSPQLDDPLEGTVVSVTDSQIVVTPPTVAGPTQLNVFVRASGRPDSNRRGLAYQMP
jgi:hypothetical protein